MSDFEMPYFVDGGGNKGYFKDTTAREQIVDTNNDLVIVKVPNSFITLESGISIITNQVFKQGNHIFGWITFGFSAQKPDNLKLGVLNTGYTTNYFVRMIAGLGTEAWACENVGYAIQDTDGALYVKGYTNNIKAAHIHIDYVI